MLVQAYLLKYYMVYQDNISELKLEKDGQVSIRKKTRYLDINLYYITDQTELDTLQVIHKPTEKPLRGATFLKFRKTIISCIDRRFYLSLKS